MFRCPDCNSSYFGASENNIIYCHDEFHVGCKWYGDRFVDVCFIPSIAPNGKKTCIHGYTYQYCPVCSKKPST